MKQTNLDTDHLGQWIGNKETTAETISVEPLQRMRAMLDYTPKTMTDGEVVPPLWHWAYFINPVRASDLGRDGHASQGEFMPPIPLPRRMWAGSQITFSEPLRVGETARRESTIRDVRLKQGRSGKLCFVEIEHAILVGDELKLTEIHTVVYRDIKQPGDNKAEPPEAPDNAQWTRELVPDSTLLFRYSALTFNGHRIHYDLDFCRHQEGYPGLVFHGPLTASLLIDLLRHHNPDKSLASCEFRAFSPLFGDAPLTLNGKMDGTDAILWATNQQGRLAMKATVSFKV
jgi:3-methylfumaryl-CoA hydratase